LSYIDESRKARRFFGYRENAVRNKRLFLSIILMLLVSVCSTSAFALRVLIVGTSSLEQYLPAENLEIQFVRSAAEIPVLFNNGGMDWDENNDHVPDAWEWNVADGLSEISMDKTIVLNGRTAASISILGQVEFPARCSLSTSFKYEKEHVYRIEGMIRTEALSGKALLSIEGPEAPITTSEITETKDWTRVTVDFSPAESGTARLRCLVVGEKGKAWFDDNIRNDDSKAALSNTEDSPTDGRKRGNSSPNQGKPRACGNQFGAYGYLDSKIYLVCGSP